MNQTTKQHHLEITPGRFDGPARDPFRLRPPARKSSPNFNPEGADTDLILREGYNYLRKPYQAGHLLQAIRQMLTGPP